MLNMSAMREIMPEKAALMDDIFGYRINSQSVPTYNITRHELSDTLAHCNISSYGNPDYQTERLRILDSCKRKVYVDMSCSYDKDYSYGNSGLYIAVSDMPIEILKAIKHEIGNIPYRKWLKNKEEEEKRKAQEKEREELTSILFKKLENCSNEELKKIVDSL